MSNTIEIKPQRAGGWVIVARLSSAELVKAFEAAFSLLETLNKEADVMAADIVIRNAAGVVQTTQYEHFDTALAAVEAGGTIQLPARTITTTTPNATLQIAKRVKVIGSTAAVSGRMIGGMPFGGGGTRTSTLRWRSADGPMIRIRNGNDGLGAVATQDSGVVLENLVIEPDRSPTPGTGDVWTRPDAPIDALRIQAGDVGTQTRVDLRNVVIQNAAGGIAQELLNAGQPNEELHVQATNVTIQDIYSVRNADGSKPVQNGSNWHAQGWYTSGGTSTRTNVTIRRVGTIAGSAVYTDSNKEQGSYSVGGEITNNNCVWEYIGHCCEQIRGANVTHNNSIFRRSPMGIQIGHKENAGNLNVPGVGQGILNNVQVLQPRAFIHPTDGPILGAGIVIDACEQCTINGAIVDGAGGTFGGWGGLHFARTDQAFINLSDITVRNWAVGVLFDEPLENGTNGTAAEANMNTIVVENCPTPWVVNWPNTQDPQGPAAIGGNWSFASIGNNFDPARVIG